MKWAKRVFWLLVAVAVVVAALFSFRPQPVAVDLGQVRRDVLEVTIDEDGKTRIKEKYIVSTPVGGRLRRIELREGDGVECNQSIVAEIEPANPNLLDARSLLKAQASVSAAKAAVERAEARSQQLKIELEQAEREFKRAEKLVGSNAISNSQFEKAQADFRATNEQMRTVNFDRDIANYELQLAEAALVHFQTDAEARESVENFSIHSPIDGVVLRLFEESSTIVHPGTRILEVGDNRDMEVVVDVLSTDAVRIRPGTRVYLEQWGGDDRLFGIVRMIEPSAFEKVSALGVEEQRVNVIVDFDEEQADLNLLGDGYRVEAKMVVWNAEDVLQVPTSALFRENNQWSVFVVKDGIANLTRVTIGQRNDQFAEVIEGLLEGDSVVLHPGDSLGDGSTVKPLQVQSGN